jgi:hypothetical protein
VDEHLKHYAKRKKPDVEYYILYDSRHMNVQNPQVHSQEADEGLLKLMGEGKAWVVTA